MQYETDIYQCIVTRMRSPSHHPHHLLIVPIVTARTSNIQQQREQSKNVRCRQLSLVSRRSRPFVALRASTRISYSDKHTQSRTQNRVLLSPLQRHSSRRTLDYQILLPSRAYRPHSYQSVTVPGRVRAVAVIQLSHGRRSYWVLSVNTE